MALPFFVEHLTNGMESTVARPVQTLREHATSFEAALSVCLAQAKPRAVHRLRTESRRLEAQVGLLEALPGLPKHRKNAEKVLRLLAKFRRAAGHVRDLDVQAKRLQSHCKRKAKHRYANTVAASESGEAEKKFSSVTDDLEDLRQMIATREHRREKAAAELVTLIVERQAKVSAALEKLLTVLEPAGNMQLGETDLLRIADRRFSKTPALARKSPSTEDLHSIRKAAKQARYLAETSGSRKAVEAAQRYEALQEAGGAWHDWLDLASQAAKELGKAHQTSVEFAELRDHRLGKYQAMLEQFR